MVRLVFGYITNEFTLLSRESESFRAMINAEFVDCSRFYTNTAIVHCESLGSGSVGRLQLLVTVRAFVSETDELAASRIAGVD